LRLLLAVLFAAASYACLTGFDYFGLRYAGHALPYRYAALTSFCSLAFGHNIGMAGLSSGAIRYRFYARHGLTVGDVAKVILFSAMTVGLGLITLGGAALLLGPQRAEQITGLGRPLVLALGAGCLITVMGYLLLAAFVRGGMKLYRWELTMPSLPLALAQVALGSVNYALVSACLYQGLAAWEQVSYPAVASVYVIAQIAALISHIPGGLGIIESTVMFLLPDANVIGALILFRLVYFLVPLCIGSVVFMIAEAVLPERARKHQGRGERGGGSRRSPGAVATDGQAPHAQEARVAASRR
jgi:uncharacterized membrane protein YbhN (UPF0104 family)